MIGSLITVTESRSGRVRSSSCISPEHVNNRRAKALRRGRGDRQPRSIRGVNSSQALECERGGNVFEGPVYGHLLLLYWPMTPHSAQGWRRAVYVPYHS